MRFKKTNNFPFGRFNAITLRPIAIFYKWDNLTMRNHESVHWKQQGELLIVFFYIIYILEWLVKLFIYGRKAYYNISFEREAYKHEKDLFYLNKRKKFAWLQYLLK